MRRATMRNAILAVSGTLTFLAAIVFADLGCGASSEDSAVASVTVTPSASSVIVGETTSLRATTYTTGGLEVTGRVITWSSSAPTVASVSESGSVTGVSAGGPVTITATSEGKSATAQVTVTGGAAAAHLTGRVIDFTTQNGIGGALVNCVNPGSGLFIDCQTTSQADGTFTSTGFTAPSGGVIIEAAHSGYVTGRVLVANVPPGVTTNTETIPLVPTSSSTGGISGTVKNARTGGGIPSATVDLYNNIAVNPIATRTADGSGVFSFTGLSAGTYRMVGNASGFQTAVRVGVAVGNNGVTAGQDMVLSASGTNDLRIVLTWGAAPSDLDSHLTGPNPDASRFHVYYNSRGSATVAPFAVLDLDDVSSFGPETITITQFNSGIYRYSVHDFTNRSSTTSTALGASGAKVEVYTSAGLVQTFVVPSQAGTLWTVFEMTGTITSPVFTPRNTMTFASDPVGILSPPANGIAGGTDAGLIGRAVQQHPKVPPP